jgi:hypothetical protein
MRSVVLVTALVMLHPGVAIATGQIAKLAQENQRRAAIQTSCAKVFLDAAEPAAQCAGTGVEAGAFSLSVAYATVAASGRALFSSLVPYNEAGNPREMVPAIFSTASDVKIGEMDVPAGVYSLYAAATGNGWQLILNRQILSRGGSYDSSEEVGRFFLAEGASPASAEANFRIVFVGVPPTPNLAQEIHLLWDDKDYYTVITAQSAKE